MTILNIHISKKAAAFAAAEAAQRGLPNAAAFAAELLEEAASSNGPKLPHTDFHNTKTDLDALVRAQGVKPISNLDELVADFWPEDETADDFLSTVRPWHQRRKPDGPDS